MSVQTGPTKVSQLVIKPPGTKGYEMLREDADHPRHAAREARHLRTFQTIGIPNRTHQVLSWFALVLPWFCLGTVSSTTEFIHHSTCMTSMHTHSTEVSLFGQTSPSACASCAVSRAATTLICAFIHIPYQHYSTITRKQKRLCS